MLRRPRLVLLLAILAVFWPALLGDYVYDDHRLVQQNAALLQSDLGALLGRPLYGAEFGYWRPLTSLLLWLGHTVGGPAGVHALALLLHSTSALLALDLLQRGGFGERAALVAALLFALHPVQVEAVAWGAAINDPLWGAATLLAVRSAACWRDAGARGAPWAAGGWVLAALLAKENAVVAPLFVLAAVAWWPGAAVPPPTRRPLQRALLPLAAAGAAWWLLRALVFGEPLAGLGHAGDVAPLATLRAVSAPAELLLRHLGLLLWPWPPTPFRSLDAAAGTAACWGFLGGAAVLPIGVVLFRRRLSPTTRFALAALLLPLLPTLVGWRHVGAHPIGERYLYLAVLGFAALALQWPRSGRARAVPWFAAACCAVGSFAQTWHWHDDAALVRHGLATAPGDGQVLVLAGDTALARAQAGDARALAAARGAYDAALRAGPVPAPGAVVRTFADARLGLAWCLLVEQRGERGPGTPALLAAFEAAVAADGRSAAAWTGLGVANAIAGRRDEAERAFRRALELEPDRTEAWTNLGRVQAEGGRRDEARASLREALRRDPGNAVARQWLDRVQ